MADNNEQIQNLGKSEIINKIKEHRSAIKDLCKSYRKIANKDKETPVQKNNKKYNYHKIYNDIYYPIITGFNSNLNDKYFPLLYNSTISPLFNDNNVYKNQLNGKYGNVFINLSGNNCSIGNVRGDFEKADDAAKAMQLFAGDRPAGYVWHHVFMGWLDNSSYSLIDDGMSIDDFLFDYREPYFYQNTATPYIYESQQPFNYYDKEIGKIRTLNANNWINCLTKMDYGIYWTPDSIITPSLMQLVKKELILGSEYLDSTDQYVIYKDNTAGGYQGDYTENDHERFRN